MATAVSYRRGTRQENDDYTGVPGEITVNLTDATLRVHTGDEVPGGYELAKQDLSTTDPSVLAYNRNGNELLYADFRNIIDTKSDRAYNIFTSTYNLAGANGENLNTTYLTTKNDDPKGPQLARADAGNIHSRYFADANPEDPTIRAFGEGKPLAYADLSNVSINTLLTILDSKFSEYMKADYSNLDTAVLAGETAGLPEGMQPLAYANLSNADLSFLSDYQTIANLTKKNDQSVNDDIHYPSTAWVKQCVNTVADNFLPTYPDTSNLPETKPEDDEDFVDPRPYFLVYDQGGAKFNDSELKWQSHVPADIVGLDVSDIDMTWLYPDESGIEDVITLNLQSFNTDLYDRVKVIDGKTDTNKTSITNLTTRISTVEGKIPAAASASNQLADKAFVNSSINNMAAFYITSNAAGDAFPTKTALLSGPYYLKGEIRTNLAFNDYALVTADESKGGATTRYLYDGVQWNFQYIVNNSPFTQGQVDAINSGITAQAVTDTAAHLVNKDNPHEVTKAQVGLGNCDNTSDANKPISTATQTALDKKANDNATVHLAGAETITGTKNFTNTIQSIFTGFDSAETTSSTDQMYFYHRSYDKDNHPVSGLSVKRRGTLGTLRNCFYAHNPQTDRWAEISVYSNDDGTTYATAPTTPATATGNEIVTASFIQGTSTFTGDKTFTGNVTFSQPINGTANRANWADLAEIYKTDKEYPIGTLVQFGGEKEVTIAQNNACHAVISEKPGYLMNANGKGQPLALCGRVQVRVVGPVKKGQPIYLHPTLNGVGIVVEEGTKCIARALETSNDENEKLVLCTTQFNLQ